jgi:hypothetical protein
MQMLRPEDVRSLTDFKRNTLVHLKELKKSGRPRLLTTNGRALVVVQDAAAYQELLDALDKAEAIAGIQRGLESFERGEGRPARESLEAALRDAKRSGRTGRRRRSDAA